MKAALTIVFSAGALLCAGLAVRDFIPEPGPPLLAEDVIDLGTVPPGRQVIEGRLTLTNDRDEPVEITGLDAGCGCMTGWEGDAVIPAGGSSTYTLRFDRSMLPSGDVNRRVMVRTKYGEADFPATTFRMNIPLPTEEPRLVVWPSVIDVGRTHVESAGIDQVLHAFVPYAFLHDKSLARIELDHPDWLDVKRLDDDVAASRKGVDGVIVRYRVTCAGRLPSGVFGAELLFTLPASDPGVIPERHAVVIRGEVVKETVVNNIGLTYPPRG